MKFEKELSGARQCSLIPTIDPLYWKREELSAWMRAVLLFPSVSDEEEDEEEVYKMAGVMAQCGGLECMLNRLAGIKDFKQGRHLLTVSRRQQDGSSPPLLEGPLRTARPLPLSPRGQHGAAERCTPGTHLAVALALHTSGSLPQCSLPDHSPPEHQCDSKPLLCLSSHLWTPVSNCLSTQNCTVSVILIII